jgi:hypothetical protein
MGDWKGKFAKRKTILFHAVSLVLIQALLKRYFLLQLTTPVTVEIIVLSGASIFQSLF